MKKTIKVLVSIALALSAILSLAGCSGDGSGVKTTHDGFSYYVAGRAFITGVSQTEGKVVFPEKIGFNEVEGIINSVFPENCEVTEVVIPQYVLGISGDVFDNCPKLEKIFVDTSSHYFYNDIDGVLYDNYKTRLVKYPSACEKTEYVIPYGVETVDYHAFYGANNLEKVVIPESVTELGPNVFVNCENLKEVVIPEGTEVDETAFINSGFQLTTAQ